MNTSPSRTLKTRAGNLTFPAYIPVTTFGEKYPLDKLIQPYLPRLAQAVMVSFHYARQMKQRPRLPVFIDSGGFAALFEGSSIETVRGLGHLRIKRDGEDEVLTPMDVLDFQEQHADVAFTLDFPVPPGLPLPEARRRQELSVANAIWAIRNRRRRDLPLYGCVQAWDSRSAREAVQRLAEYPFDGFAIGGLVPRAQRWDLVQEIVEAVLAEAGARPVHVFGLGKPETTRQLFALGVSSVDSSSYVKLAADGLRWSDPEPLTDPSPIERLHLAIENLSLASRSKLPLAFHRPPPVQATLDFEPF